MTATTEAAKVIQLDRSEISLIHSDFAALAGEGSVGSSVDVRALEGERA